MASTIITPNMGLPNPVPGIDTGPDYANNIQSCFNQIDQHNHSSGQGVQIGPSGINLNAPLPFNNNPATGLGGVTFIEQTSYSPVNSLWVGTDGNLYFNDGVSDPAIKITSGGGVQASSSGISSGAASASFSSGVLVVNAATNTPANIKGASLLMGNNSAGSNYLTLSPPAAMGSNITETLPTIPAVASLMQMDTSGNMSASIAVSGGIVSANISPTAGILGSQLSATAGILGSQLSATAGILGPQLTNKAVTSTQIADNTIGKAQLSAGTLATTTVFSSAVVSVPYITLGSVTLTSYGGPVIVIIAGGIMSEAGGTNPAPFGLGLTANAAPIYASSVIASGTSPINMTAIFSPGGSATAPVTKTYYMNIQGNVTWTAFTLQAYEL